VKSLRWSIWWLYIALGISAPLLCMRWHAPFTKEGWMFVLVMCAVVISAGVINLYLLATRPKELKLDGATIKKLGERDMLVVPNPPTEQERKETDRPCVFVVCCNPGSKGEISFATELSPCPQKAVYEDRARSLEIFADGRTMLIPNERGWQDDNPEKILIHRQFDCTPEDVAAFRRDPIWTQVKQKQFMA
jgi:hypothetical protein